MAPDLQSCMLRSQQRLMHLGCLRLVRKYWPGTISIRSFVAGLCCIVGLLQNLSGHFELHSATAQGTASNTKLQHVSRCRRHWSYASTSSRRATCQYVKVCEVWPSQKRLKVIAERETYHCPGTVAGRDWLIEADIMRKDAPTLSCSAVCPQKHPARPHRARRGSQTSQKST